MIVQALYKNAMDDKLMKSVQLVDTTINYKVREYSRNVDRLTKLLQEGIKFIYEASMVYRKVFKDKSYKMLIKKLDEEQIFFDESTYNKVGLFPFFNLSKNRVNFEKSRKIELICDPNKEWAYLGQISFAQEPHGIGRRLMADGTLEEGWFEKGSING